MDKARLDAIKARLATAQRGARAVKDGTDFSIFLLESEIDFYEQAPGMVRELVAEVERLEAGYLENMAGTNEVYRGLMTALMDIEFLATDRGSTHQREDLIAIARIARTARDNARKGGA